MTEYNEPTDSKEDSVEQENLEESTEEIDVDDDSEDLGFNSEIIWTLSPELTSTLAFLTSSIDAITSAISSLAQHPYDLAKSLYFEPSYIFPTIDSVEVPEMVTLETLARGFEKNHVVYQDRIIDYISNPLKYDVSEAGDQLNLLAELSGDSKFIVTPERYSSYITTLEMIQNLNIDDVNDENCEELILKIGYSVLNTFCKKTLP